MKYDDIILQCCGDCELCAVYLECQYQTSVGDEKQEYLKLLTERDENLSVGNVEKTDKAESADDTLIQEETFESNESLETEKAIETTSEVQSISEEHVSEEYVSEEYVSEETAKVPNEEAADAETVDKPDAEINDNDNALNIPNLKKAQTEEVKNDVFASNEVVTQKEVLPPPDAQTVSNIYNEVFGITVLTEEIEVATATETSEEVKTVDVSQQPQVEAKRFESKNKYADVTPITDKTVEQIYNEVFNLDNIKAQSDSAEKVEKTTLSEEVDAANRGDLEESRLETVPVIEKEKCQNERSTLQGASREAVEQIYNEVFGLTLRNNEKSVDTDDKTETNKPEVLEQATDKPEEVVQANRSEQSAKTEDSQTPQEVLEQPAATTVPEAQQEQPEEPVKEKETFKLTPPENNEELMANMCAKRARKLIYKPSEPIITASFKVLGTDKKNDIGEKVKDILDAEIKQGVKVGYLDKFDGLSSSEIKEEYENDIVYEFADQEFKKTGVIYDGSKIKVYVYDWDGKACHHVGYVDTTEAAELIPYFVDKEKYSFDICGIITGGKGKRVVKEGSTLKIIKEKGEPIGVDVDIVILNRKD